MVNSSAVVTRKITETNKILMWRTIFLNNFCFWKSKKNIELQFLCWKEKMPRAFLITHRRYNGIEELEESRQGNFFLRENEFYLTNLQLSGKLYLYSFICLLLCLIFFYFILFSFILFGSLLFYFVLFYFILFPFIVLYLL